MALEELTPKHSGLYKRYPRLASSGLCGAIALIAVFLVILLAYLLLPPVW